MALCLIASQHGYRDLQENNLSGCTCIHCTGFCSCDSNTGPDNPRNIETDDEGSYAEHLERRRAWVDYLSKKDE